MIDFESDSLPASVKLMLALMQNAKNESMQALTRADTIESVRWHQGRVDLVDQLSAQITKEMGKRNDPNRRS